MACDPSAGCPCGGWAVIRPCRFAPSWTSPRADEVWRVTRPDGGGGKGPPSVSSKVNRRVKIQTALERSRRKIRLCWPYFLTCDVTGRSNKVKLYWFTVANCLSRKTNLPNKMELNKPKYHRNYLGVATWAYFEDLCRHVTNQKTAWWISRTSGRIVKIQTAVKRHHII